MNSRTALPCKWRTIGAYALILPALAGSAAAAPVKSAAPRPADARAREHAVDFAVSKPTPAPKDLLLPAEDVKKSDALAAFVDGLIAEENADGDAALEAFRKVLSLDPGYADLAIKVAYEQARRGDVTAGINTLKDAIKARPKDPLPCLYLSQLYSKYLRKPDQALKYAQQALTLDPKNFAANIAVFELYLGTGQDKKAEQALDHASHIENDDPQYWVQLAEFYTKLVLKEDGTATPENLEKINGIFRRSLDAALGEDPVIIAKIADFYVLAREVKEAIPLYLQVLKLKKKAPPELSIANVQDKLARSFRVNGQRDEAIDMLQQLIQQNPLRYESYELLGELYEERGDFDKALASYQQTLLIDSSQPINYLRVADMFLKNKQFDKAVDLLKEARRRFPDLPQLTYSLAVTLGQGKRYAESVPLFEEALREAENKQQEMINAAFYFSYGAAAERAGLIEKAIELLRKSIELDPANAAEAYNYLGYMWVERGENLDEAGDLIQRALSMEPDNAAYMDSLGWFHYHKGDYDKAVTELLKAAELMKPDDAVVFEHVADAYAKTNNIAQALVFWQKAAALDSGNKAIAEKIENAKQKVTANPPAKAPAN